MKIILFFLIFILALGFTCAEPTLHTPKILTVSSSGTTVDISFFNDGKARLFSAAFFSDDGFAYLEDYSVFVDKESYGSFSLVIGKSELEPGIYIGRVVISDESGELFEIPVVYGEESDNPKRFDVSIDYNGAVDTNFLSGELIISPNLGVYKLNFDPSNSNNVVVEFAIYDSEGNLIESSEDTLAVSTRSSFEQFSNLGTDYPKNVILVATVTHAGSSWMDVEDIRLPESESEFSLSPPEGKDYSAWIYFGVFALLVFSMIALSYFWNHRVMNQAHDWRSRVNYIKKTQFTDGAKAMRKLKYQKDVLDRAYSSNYITKDSYTKGIAAIENLSSQLKKRL